VFASVFTIVTTDFEALYATCTWRVSESQDTAVELIPLVDPAAGLANWTTSRKYVVNRPRICNVNHHTVNGHPTTRNTLDCDQSNYSSRIVFSYVPIEFGPTGNSAIRSADLENPTVEPNIKWIA